MNKNFSQDMHLYTEQPGQYLPDDAHKIIKHRYQVATELSKGKNTLEIGVGQGFGVNSIAKFSSRYTGIEYSSENIERLGKVRYGDRIIHGDAHKTLFDDSEFETINALAMIYYLDFDKFLHEATRILSKNGTFFFCTSNKDAPGFVPAPLTTQYYSIPELNNILKEHGFEVAFYGSFPSYERYKILGNIRVVVKDILKKVINVFPNGDIFWKKLRDRHLGGLKKLPDNIDNINADENWSSNFHKLGGNVKNSQYRIIYCIAKLTNKYEK